MTDLLLEWISIALRWWHVLAGIAWVGASFYFNWFDSLVRETTKQTRHKNNRGVLNEVHGGNFYYHEQYFPQQLPEGLHAHSWPAKMTFYTGLALLVVIYWFGASSYMIDASVADISSTTAIAISAGSITLCWLIYHLLCKATASNRVVLLAMTIITAIAAYGFQQVLSGRATWVSVGVMLGSLMGLNVILVIAPQSIAMKKQLVAGDGYDHRRGFITKRRSQHNNYLTIPVVITMVSNHFAFGYNHQLGWLILLLLMSAGWGIRYSLNCWYKQGDKPALAIAGICLAAIAAVAISLYGRVGITNPETTANDSEILHIVQTHCTNCHAVTPNQPGFAAAPQGLVLETLDQLLASSPKIYNRTIVTRDMPLANLTGMTEEQRQTLGNWLQQHDK